jgi:hypothetical protein
MKGDIKSYRNLELSPDIKKIVITKRLKVYCNLLQGAQKVTDQAIKKIVYSAKPPKTAMNKDQHRLN